MNLKDITPYIIEKTARSFNRKLSQDDTIVQELLKLNADNGRTIICLAQFGGKYRLYRIGNDVYEVNYSGTWCVFKYQGFTLSGYFTLDGEANKVLLVDWLWERSSEYEVKNIETLDTIYQELLEETRNCKREMMNHYNKLIKDTKQEYKRELEKHNNLLKGEKE